MDSDLDQGLTISPMTSQKCNRLINKEKQRKISIMIGIAGHLEAGLVCVRDDVLPAVGQPVTRQAQRHAEAAILLLELLVSRALVLSSL